MAICEYVSAIFMSTQLGGELYLFASVLFMPSIILECYFSSWKMRDNNLYDVIVPYVTNGLQQSDTKVSLKSFYAH